MQQIGRYEILRELGHGAMGVVYEATDPLIGRKVAIKTIRLDNLGDASVREDLTRRLFREAQSAGILSHPGIITVFDIGQSGNDAYIVMEFVAGKTLEDLLGGGVPQPSATLLSILGRAAEALDYAHSKGIVHRDIKPSNIMISDAGVTKIADFGVAKLSTSTSLTQAGFVLGTPSYMSPEHAQGRDVDGRADQFSLAVVAFRMLTGKLPFDGPTLTAVLSKILWEEPEYENSGILPSLRPTFEKAFSKEPQQRFASCVDFVKELESIYAQHKAELKSKAAAPPAPEPIPVTLPISEPTLTPKAEFKPAPVSDQYPAKKKSNILVWVALALALILVVAAGAVFFKNRSSSQAPGIESSKVDEPQVEEPRIVQQTIKEPEPMEKSMPVQPPAPVIPLKEAPKTQPTGLKPAANKTVVPETAVTGVDSGTLTWFGNWSRNSILVIENQKASFGTVEGDMFPGQPIEIEVVPSELTIRQAPDATNSWKQVILYNGTARLSSVSIHWQRKTK